jgi:mannose-6-phosphate isomerase
MQPLVFEPYLRPQIWGGRQLQERLGKPLPAEGTFGECWEVSAHPHHVSRVAEGPLRGATLADLWRDRGRDLLGRAPGPGEKFPLLVKFLDCREMLSVQVHPDDATACRLIGDELGKTEAWVVLHAGPQGRIYAGLKPGIDRAALERHLAEGSLAECLHAFEPRAGDCLLLRAGTVHAVGGGVLLAEVQQSSDATFRLFDWGHVGPDGCPRTLHVPQALESIDWTIGPVEPIAGTPLPEGDGGATGHVGESLRDSHSRLGEAHPRDATGQKTSGEQLATCPYFELRRYHVQESLACSPGRMAIVMLLAGTADLESPGGFTRRFAAGQTALIPAATPSVIWQNRGEGPVVILEALSHPPGGAACSA